MSDDIKGLMIGACTIAVVIMTIAGCMTWYHYNLHRQYIEGGYEQRTLQGEGGVHWVKIKDEPQAEINP